MEMEYASRGKGNAALTTGIIGTTGVGLGLLGNLLGVGRGGGCYDGVNHSELFMSQRIGDLEAQIALRDANIYGDQKLLEMYKYFDSKLGDISEQLCRQQQLNTYMQTTLNNFAGLTKTVIPREAICPEVMQRYNSWVAPTAAAPDTTG